MFIVQFNRGTAIVRSIRQSSGHQAYLLIQSMKRTRPQCRMKNASSTAPERYFSTKNDTLEPSKIDATGIKSDKLTFENLKLNQTAIDKSGGASTVAKKKKLRGTVNLEMMKEELKQLEDPPVTQEEKATSSKKLSYSFFNIPCMDLAKKLLGKILVRRLENGIILKGRIVETEAYLGEIDKASQTYEGKITPRNLPMYMLPGTIYVYLTYGMYHCFNISSGGKGCAVLLRALEPLVGVEEMTNRRTTRLKSRQGEAKKLAKHEICNGPSKLCIALEIDKSHCKYSICNYKSMWIENDETTEDFKIVESTRIGIDSAGPEWANKLLRYYIFGNTSVSKRDKKAEADFLND
ncbi:putative 3-methyladenine DNA glycosylase isoform X2 [Venturia canescens]|uniref:putative 3-methyladenine DNA glycosylase isoform X2 n=1 Tax=Venturia canescens TaxID=32260 RepID=UPI001C9C394D|nr:putative 3-methyladenine DNA glycosylase isoform X2 [Venturia canescens]